MSPFPSAKGELFRYSNSASACVAFEYDLSKKGNGRGIAIEARKATAANPSVSTSTPKTKLAVVAVGGLTDGFFALPYLPHLAELLGEDAARSDATIEWSLVTPLLSSSHRGWGTSSLDRDAAELSRLSAHLGRHRGVEGVVLLGHSTGCQDAVRFAERERERTRGARAARCSDDDDDDDADEGEGEGKEELEDLSERERRPRGGVPGAERPRLLGVVLQAPVSDRECFFLDARGPAASAARERLERAREAARQGREPRTTVIDFMSEWDDAPLSAERWLSLAERGGDDDYFSSDFSDEELSRRLWALGGGRGAKGAEEETGQGGGGGGGGGHGGEAMPTLIISSLREQYLPETYDTAAQGRRLAEAINRLGLSKDGAKSSLSSSSKSPPPLPPPPEAKAFAVALDGDHALKGAEPEAARVIFDFISTKCSVPLAPSV